MINYIKTAYENSKLHKHNLIKKYKLKIIPGIKSQTEIINLLKNEFDLVEISSTDVEPIFWKHGVIKNVSYFNSNNDKNQFIIYKVLSNNKSKKLYSYARKMSELMDDDIIFIVFEKATNYMTSNVSKVQTKLLLLQGVSEYDYNNNTPVLINYIRMLEHYNVK